MSTPIAFSSFRASAPQETTTAQLGSLGELPGTWVGKGFNLISLPNGQNNNLPLPFRLKLNSTIETLTFTPIGGPIPNLGGTASDGSPVKDIFFVGVHYLQQVSDAIATTGLHIEPGMWLNLPDGRLARMATIPHGDALLAQGPLINNGDPIQGGPLIQVTDSTPFKLDPQTGARVNIADPLYLAQFNTMPLPDGIPAGATANPNLVLTNAINGQNIVETTVLKVSANPIGGINNTTPTPPAQPVPVGGILNIPFVIANANANAFSATFWVEKVQSADGSTFLQLQYTQTVILDFIGIKWPHISVATLIKQ